MRQEHYGAFAMLLAFLTALLAEALPMISAICVAGVVGCVIKGELWEFKEGRGDAVDNDSDR